MVDSISSLSIDCLKSFSALSLRKELAWHDTEVPTSLWKGELGRLRLWVANIGAHLTDGVDQEDDEILLQYDDGTAAQQIYSSLATTVGCLFQISMIVRRPAQHDRLLGTKKLDTTVFEPFDKQHVANKYPQAHHIVADRLGVAISRRRATLKYRKRHREKLGEGIDQPEAVSTRLSATVATAFEEAPADLDETGSNSGVSQTSYATSLWESGDKITVPRPPKESSNGRPFECPYCFFVVTISNRRSWIRHVFRDLMPYVCVFPDCPASNRLYESRREWYQHLRTNHLSGPVPSDNVDCTLHCGTKQPFISLERHLGKHLEELALFALPRADEAEEEDSDRSHDSTAEAKSEPLSAPRNNAELAEEIDLVRNSSSEDDQDDEAEQAISSPSEPQEGLMAGASIERNVRKVGYAAKDFFENARKSDGIIRRGRFEEREADERAYQEHAKLEPGEESQRRSDDEQPVSCPICDSEFTHYRAFNDHLLSQHWGNPTGEENQRRLDGRRRIGCPICDSEFALYRDFNDHLLTHHSETTMPASPVNSDSDNDPTWIKEHKVRVADLATIREENRKERQAELEKSMLRKDSEKIGEEKGKERAEEEGGEEEFERGVREKFMDAGYTPEYVEEILQKKKEERPTLAIEQTRETFIKVNRKYLRPATLEHYSLPWEWDVNDGEYIVIKKYVGHKLQDELFEHTRQLKERRQWKYEKVVPPRASSK